MSKLYVLTSCTGQREQDAIDQIRALRYKQKRHLAKKDQLYHDDMRKQILDILERDWNRNISDPLKQWAGGGNVVRI